MGELPGVSVVVKGTTNGTITTLDGSFKLDNVKSSDILQFSFVGYKTQEIKVGNQKTFNVTLQEDAQALDEVVVVAVGYGDVKRRDLTGAIGKANMSDLTKTPINNVAETLGGRIAGVQVSCFFIFLIFTSSKSIYKSICYIFIFLKIHKKIIGKIQFHI